MALEQQVDVADAVIDDAGESLLATPETRVVEVIVTRLSAEKGDRENGISTKSYLLLGQPHGASVLAAVQAAAGFAGARCARSPDCRCARCWWAGWAA